MRRYIIITNQKYFEIEIKIEIKIEIEILLQ